MLACFDFKRLFEEPLQDCQKQAVVRLADYFRSRADTMVWPDFDYVSHSWPDSKEIQRQFHVFSRILRDNRGRPSWHRTVAARVSLLQPQPLLTGLSKAGLEGCFRMLPSSCHVPRKEVLRIIAGRVNAFLERAPPGDCVRLLKHPGGLALVDTLEREVDSVAVVASFMQEQELHQFRLRNRSTHCWHMVYLLSLCSCMNSQSCDCERVGSHLHQVESGGTVRSPARVADRLRFKVSGVKGIGGVRDEALIRTLVQTLLLARKRPFVQTKQRGVRRRLGDPTCGHLGSMLLIQDANKRGNSQHAGCGKMQLCHRVHGSGSYGIVAASS
ncbi:unnamed protein product [Symbiodinium sp. CCMP2592]|nr:unnamed protein product [Symbiodinium sp. CCMP2592]